MILPIVVPVLFWSAYHLYRDRHLPEPPLNLAFCLLLGIGASFVSAAMYRGLGLIGLRFDAVALADSSPLGLLAYAVFAIGPIEEFAKLLPFLIFVLRFKAFDEIMDGMIYASFIALGYAAAENVHYLQFLTPTEAIARGFAGPIIHILFASIWGHWIALARFEGGSVPRCAFFGFLIAAFLHGIYDFIVLLRPMGALPVAAALILFIWIWRIKLMHMLHLDAVAETNGRNAD